MKSSKKKIKRGRILLAIIAVYLLGSSLVFDNSIDLTTKVIIQEGDTIKGVYSGLNGPQSRSLRWYLYKNNSALKPLQVGSYVFSGTYSPSDIIQIFNDGPQLTYQKITVLEGRSIYDIDDFLFKKGLIEPGEYISYVSDASVIDGFAKRFDFVQEFISTKATGRPSSLEGLLYPDTYHLSFEQPVIDQLVLLQLKTFQKKVYNPLSDKIKNFSDTLASQGFSFGMRWYNIVVLASIIEKEERNSVNKPYIAGIFLNRIQSGMRIDADITLCYGLHQGYESCTPSLIAQGIYDSNNLYNTRIHSGLTPSPISNPSITSFESLVNFQKSNYYYYLHASNGKIYYGTTLQEHNANKRYL